MPSKHIPSHRRSPNLPPHKQNNKKAAVARATYVDAALTPSNFGKLRVATAAGAPDRDQAYAAGFAEGWLTAARIHDHHHNLHAYFTGTLNVSLGEPMAWCVAGGGLWDVSLCGAGARGSRGCVCGAAGA